MATIYRTKNASASRLDPWHYQPSFLDAEGKVRSSGRCSYLGEVLDKSRGVAGGATPLGAEYASSGRVRFYRTADVRNLSIQLDDAVFISDEQDEALARSRLAKGDMVLTITGVYFGQTAVVGDRHVPGNISQHSVRFAVEQVDSHYLVAYFSSVFGQSVIWRRAYGATRPAIDYPGIQSLLIRLPDSAVQKYIGDKVRIAEQLRAFGNEWMNNGRAVVELVNDGQLSPIDLENDQFSWSTIVSRLASPHTAIDAKHDRVDSRLLGDRIDSWYYKPEFVRGDSQLQAIRELGIETPTLESFASVSYGFMPTEDYWSPSVGALFLRVTNIQDHLRLDLSKLEFVNPTLSKAARYRLTEDDIVCVQCGNSTGRIALITSRCNDWVYPSFALRIRLKDRDWDAAYVAGYLASWLGQSQIQRTISITSVRPNTTKPAIEAVTVPKFPLRTQQLIGARLRTAINCVEQSVPLTDAAKLLVEALINSNVKEDELIHAQMRLEQGDNELDRAILSRLFEGGMDATETRPLFPDLDAYYETLRMVKLERSEVFAK